MDDLREGFRAEKKSLVEKIARSEAGTASRATSTPIYRRCHGLFWPVYECKHCYDPAVSMSVTTASSTPVMSTSPSTV